MLHVLAIVKLRLYPGTRAVFAISTTIVLLLCILPGLALFREKRVAPGVLYVIVGVGAAWLALFLSGVAAALIMGTFGTTM